MEDTGQAGEGLVWYTKLTSCSSSSDLTYYSITPQSETVTIHRVISHFTTPKPKSLPQTAEFISMLWKADLLDVVAGLSPEELARVEELKVKVKTPTPRILDTSAPEGFVLSHANGATTVAFNLKGSLGGLEPQVRLSGFWWTDFETDSLF